MWLIPKPPRKGDPSRPAGGPAALPGPGEKDFEDFGRRVAWPGGRGGEWGLVCQGPQHQAPSQPAAEPRVPEGPPGPSLASAGGRLQSGHCSLQPGAPRNGRLSPAPFCVWAAAREEGAPLPAHLVAGPSLPARLGPAALGLAQASALEGGPEPALHLALPSLVHPRTPVHAHVGRRVCRQDPQFLRCYSCSLGPALAKGRLTPGSSGRWGAARMGHQLPPRGHPAGARGIRSGPARGGVSGGAREGRGAWVCP